MKTARPRRVKYNPGSIDSTMAAALKVAKVQTCYVFATGLGFVIDDNPPGFDQKYYKVTSDGVERSWLTT